MTEHCDGGRQRQHDSYPRRTGPSLYHEGGAHVTAVALRRRVRPLQGPQQPAAPTIDTLDRNHSHVCQPRTICCHRGEDSTSNRTRNRHSRHMTYDRKARDAAHVKHDEPCDLPLTCLRCPEVSPHCRGGGRVAAVALHRSNRPLRISGCTGVWEEGRMAHGTSHALYRELVCRASDRRSLAVVSGDASICFMN